MTNYPNNYDDDSTIPAINDNLTSIGGDVINDLRDANFAMQQAIGLNPQGSASSLAARLAVSINPDGTIIPSVITSLGLVTLPIYDSQVARAAGITESKLLLDYPTQDLFNYIRDLSRSVDLSLGWISATGSKLDPHLIGLIYRHDLLQIDVIGNSALYLNSVFRVNRDNTNAYTLINGINNELLAHQWADGSQLSNTQDITTNGGYVYPSNFAHIASGIFLDTSGFAVIPQTDNSVQSAFNYIDANSIYLLGTRIQNLYHNGISANSRSSSLIADGYGQSLVPFTPAIAYLKGSGNQTSPVDNFMMGDDIIQFTPSSALTSNFSFDEQFLRTRIGDILRVDYSADGYNVIIPSVISEIKYVPGSGSTPSTYMVRIAGKNIAYAPNAIARIDRTLFNNNKYGVLATANVNTTGITSIVSNPVMPSLIIGSPRGAQCLGIGFSSDDFNEDKGPVGGTAGSGHFLLYLVLYPDGNPLHGSVALPAIDVTGNEGQTPGRYTLESIVNATNNAFRAPGFNYRFIAYSYQGEFGIMLADSYNNASFSIISAPITSGGAYDPSAAQLNYPNNVVDVFTSSDALGLGPTAANVASPPFQSSFTTSAAAQMVTQIFAPLRRNNYYVNGAELERMDTDVAQTIDSYGDGYWVGTIDGYPILNAGPPGHTTVTYQIPLDLSASNLKSGKTIVVQSLSAISGGVDYGRFIIQDITFSACNCPNSATQTLITVYDAVHGSGVSPYVTAGPGTQVAIYFSSDSVSFDNETATDFSAPSPNVPFKRFFEVYVDENEKTYTHERARFSTTINTIVNGVTLFNSSASFGSVDLLSVSTKLRGYSFGPVTKITLLLNNYNSISGVYDGYLCSTTNGLNFINYGQDITGKIGEVTRFYDQSNIDYVDIRFPVNSSFGSFTSQYFDIQLFPTLELDQDIMLISSCQIDNNTQIVNQLSDNREFGNISEEELSTSAKNYISLPERLLHFNGVVRGFDISNITNEFISLNGGMALVNGNFADINKRVITVPKIQEQYSVAPFTSPPYPIIFALCVNSDNELVLFPIIDTGLLGTPTVDRVMTVTNEVSLNTYQVDSDGFSDVLNNRKDLTVLYLIESVVTGTGTAATVTATARDARRFINDSDSSIIAVVTDDNSQGNFQSLPAALNWLRFNGEFQEQLQVKGAITITTDPGFYGIPGLQVTGNGTAAALNFNATSYLSGVTFNNLIINVSDTLNVNTVSGNLTGQVTFNNCTIQVTTTNGFTVGSNVTFNGCTITHNYNAMLNGSYVSADLVNAGFGMIYANLGGGGRLQNLTITNNTFIMPFADHFCPVSLQFSDFTALGTSIKISNNTFITQTAEDIRAVVALTSTLTSQAGLGYPLNPKVVNLSIENNICNQDQMIIVTGTTSLSSTPANAMIGAALTATNSRIFRNVCGTIGYFLAANDTADFSNTGSVNNTVVIRDKDDCMIISENTCHLITNLNANGTWMPFEYFAGSGYHEGVQVPTGQVNITNNTANWIVVGAFSSISAPGAGVNISGNTCNPANPNYLLNYANNITSISPPAYGIYLQSDILVTIGNSQSTISDNILVQNQLYTTVGLSSGPYYYQNAIVIENNALVLGNLINGVVSGSFSSPIQINILNGNALVSGNQIIRADNLIVAYISGNSGSSASVTITDNFFDSLYIDINNTIFNDVSIFIPAAWTYSKNINQVCYASIAVHQMPVASNDISILTYGSGGLPGSESPATISLNTIIDIFATGSGNATFTANLSFLLPNTKILYAAAGLCSQAAITPQSGSIITMGLFVEPLVNTNTLNISSSYLNSILDIKNNATYGSIVRYAPTTAQYPITTSGEASALVSATQYLYIDQTSAPINITTGYEVKLTFNASDLAVGSGSTALAISPIVIRYTFG